jgi:hypothetical protein
MHPGKFSASAHLVCIDLNPREWSDIGTHTHARTHTHTHTNLLKRRYEAFQRYTIYIIRNYWQLLTATVVYFIIRPVMQTKYFIKIH